MFHRSIEIKVIDTGCGIDDQKKEQILKAERFKHGGFKHGSGIGLCISIGLIKLFKSELEIISPYNYNGTCFQFNFDIESTKKPIEFISNDIEPDCNLDNLKIIITDDQKLNHIVLEKQLNIRLFKYKNIEIIHLYSGEDCLEYLKYNSANIIIMDQVMEQDKLLGTETNIKIREFNKEIIIIQASGNCQNKDNKLYFDSGVNHIWGKPIQFKNIEKDFKYLMKDKNYFRNKTK